jgi:hypothetical protein
VLNQALRQEGLWGSGRVRRLLVTANIVPTSPIPVTLMMEALSSSTTSVLTRATRRNIPEDAILQSHVLFYVLSVFAWLTEERAEKKNFSQFPKRETPRNETGAINTTFRKVNVIQHFMP